MNREISSAPDQVRAAYRRACDALGVTAHPKVVVQGGLETWPSGPVLCEKFEDTGHYAIVWDGGAEWTAEDGSPWHLAASAAASNGEVYAEPKNHWSVMLYPGPS